MTPPNRPSHEPPPWYRPAPVRQVPYDERWPGLYCDEAPLIEAALGDHLVAIEHVGSTAVPGLAAKPIIDILAAVSGWDPLPEMVRALAAIGYLYTPHSEADDPGRRVFRKPSDMEQERTHHLHVTELGSAYWTRIVAFRDHLRRHPDDAAAYALLKARLAIDYADDSRAYTAAKAAFVAGVESKAGVRRA